MIWFQVQQSIHTFLIIFNLLVTLNQIWLRTCILVDIKLKFWEKDYTALINGLHCKLKSQHKSVDLQHSAMNAFRIQKAYISMQPSLGTKTPIPKFWVKFSSKNEVFSSCFQSQATWLSSVKCSHDYFPTHSFELWVSFQLRTKSWFLPGQLCFPYCEELRFLR